MEQEVIVLFARPYNFKEEGTGREVKGVSVYYINKNATNTEKDGFGFVPVKVSLETAECLTNIPGKYKANFMAVPSARGIQLKLSSLEFMEKVELWSMSQAK